MKKKYSDEVIYLSERTGISRYRCNIVLDECGGDMNTAYILLGEISSNKYEKAMDNISSFVRGEKGSNITISDGGDVIFSMPGMIPIFLLLFLDVPSWVIALVLLLLTVFSADLEIRQEVNEQKPIKTVNVDEYTKKKNIRMRMEAKMKMSSSTDDGYNEIIIE